MEQKPIKQNKAQLATATAKRFYEVLGQYNLAAVRTATDVKSSRTPTVKELVCEFGENPVENYIAGHIITLRDFVNMSHLMTDEQTRMTAALAVSEFTDLTLADIALIFRRAKLGEYGDFYGRMDGVMILKWFTDYRNGQNIHPPTVYS